MRKILLLIILAMTLTACSEEQVSKVDQGIPVEEPQVESEEGDQEQVAEEEAEEIFDPKELIDLSLKPNEAGKIMVLMYHNIGQEEQEWTRTAENFRKDLQVLYDKGYRPISLRDYAKGNITTAQGYTPIVITFDDGNKNNFEYLEDGSIKEDTAVGILMDFHKENPDFSPATTFFLNGDLPFGQRELISDKFEYLIENGMDIGNHSRTHANFTEASVELLQSEIGGQVQYLESFLENQNYSVDTIALPYGTRPKDDTKTKYLKEGSYEGIPYEKIAILNVGWNPSHSPYDSRFNPESIPRIRASEMKVDNVGMYNYIEYFDNNPDQRFISDGIPEIITVPQGNQDLLGENLDKEVYIYDK